MPAVARVFSLLCVPLLGGLMLACTGSSGAAVGPTSFDAVQPFMLEAEIVSESDGLGLALTEEEDSLFQLRWWFRDSTTWRQEFESVLPEIDAAVVVTVSDGAGSLTFDPREAVVSRREVASPAFPSFSILLGPSLTPDLDAFMDRFRDFGLEVAIVGEDEILGRQVTVVEVLGGESRETIGSLPESFEAGESWSRYAVDEASMFVLRTTIQRLGRHAVGSVTKLELAAEFAPEFTADLTVLELPAGVREAELGGSGSCSVSETVGVGEGAIAPGPFLSTYVLSSSGQGSWTVSQEGSAYGCGIQRVDFTQGSLEGRHLRVAQRRRRDGMPESLRVGEMVIVGEHEAWASMEDGTRRLVWMVGDVVVVVTGRDVSEAGLFAVAESLG